MGTRVDGGEPQARLYFVGSKPTIRPCLTRPLWGSNARDSAVESRAFDIRRALCRRLAWIGGAGGGACELAILLVPYVADERRPRPSPSIPTSPDPTSQSVPGSGVVVAVTADAT